MEKIKELYPADTEARLERQNKTWTILTAAAAVILLAVCITLCVLTGTANAAAMEIRVCLISLIGGWAVIFCYVHFIAEGRRELKHYRNLQEEERQAVTGTVTLDPMRFAIRGSITVQDLIIRRGDREQRVHVNAKKAALLPVLPAQLTVYTVHGYAVAWEVQDAAR